jgi:lambda repressor-like predicted transcriptional regulator
VRERFYDLPAHERDRLILELRAKGWSLRRIGVRVGMTGSGVYRSLERIERGAAGVDRRG